MSHGNDQLAVAVQEALKEGEIAAPDALVALVGTLENPVQALLNMDSANQLFDALDSEFGFIRLSFVENRRAPAAEILPADRLRYAALVRWLIRELCTWRSADGLRQVELVTAFVVAQRCDVFPMKSARTSIFCTILSAYLLPSPSASTRGPARRCRFGRAKLSKNSGGQMRKETGLLYSAGGRIFRDKRFSF
jgi:hypothetical protein